LSLLPALTPEQDNDVENLSQHSLILPTARQARAELFASSFAHVLERQAPDTDLDRQLAAAADADADATGNDDDDDDDDDGEGLVAGLASLGLDDDDDDDDDDGYSASTSSTAATPCTYYRVMIDGILYLRNDLYHIFNLDYKYVGKYNAVSRKIEFS
jgi:hypothetical protein